MLRIEDKIVISSNLPGSIEVLLDDYKIIICYDDSKQKGEELESLRKEKDNLETSIERRKKLLANENYVAKAPEKIVNQERDNLAHEEAQLKIILQRLEQLN